MAKNFEALISRHSKKGDYSQDYPGLSKDGVEYSKQKTENIIQALKAADPGSIFFFAGVSDQPRTRSTADVYINALKEEIDKNNLDITVLDEERIKSAGTGPTDIIKNLSEELENNPDKKYVVYFPMKLKENKLASRWMAEDGKNWSPYVMKLFEMHNNDNDKAFREWLINRGEIDGLKGPDPVDEAKLQIQGISRLGTFVEKHIGKSRPIIIGGVGHSWTIDAMLVYLANNGDVSPEGFDKVGGKLIGESNFAKIAENGNGEIILVYNGTEYPVNRDLIEKI
jgi:hypothetical protein